MNSIQKTATLAGYKAVMVKEVRERDILRVKDLQEEPFTLRSGRQSYVYWSARDALREKAFRILAASCLRANCALYDVKPAYVAGVPQGAIPLGVALAEALDADWLLTRPALKQQATAAAQTVLVGSSTGESPVLVVEDTVTTAGSVMAHVDALVDVDDVRVTAIAVLFDRSFGAMAQACAARDITYVPLLMMDDVLTPEQLALEKTMAGVEL